MDQITASLAAETPRWFEDRVAAVTPLQGEVTRGVRTWMLMLLAAVGFLLATACVNLANLMLIRATTRVRELSVRAALGASRTDLLRTLLVEALVLSLTGALLGVLLAWAGVAVLGSIVPAEVPRAALIAIDFRVLFVAALTAIATGLLFGIAPALRFSRLGAGFASLHAERGSTGAISVKRLRGVLVVAQVALALVLLMGSGLFLASFSRVTAVDLGFEHANILSVRVRPLVSAEMPAALRENRDKLLRIRERVSGIPGVQAVDLVAGSLPLRGDLRTVRLEIPGRVLSKNEDIALNEISPTYFSTLRIPMLHGRSFTENDRQGSDAVVILSDAAARKYFAQGSALGNVLRLDVERRIVGIAGSVRDRGPEHDPRSQAYVPLAQRQLPGATIVLRSTAGASVLPAVREAIWAEFPDLPLPDQYPLGHLYEALVAQRRFMMVLMGLFGSVAAVIAGAGIFGVVAYSVAERTKEIGIRVAIGASSGAVLRMVLQGALQYLTIGVLIGLPTALVLSQAIRTYLFEIQPHDSSVYLAVIGVFLLTTLIAAYVPARRAAQIDPIAALRTE